MRKGFAIIIALVMVLMAFVAIGGNVSAQTTWYVDDDNCPGPGSGTQADPFCKIQDAIDAASPYDTIIVAAGTYTEYLHITTDDLTIEGAGIDNSIIDLDGLTPYWHYGSCSGSYASRAGVYIVGYTGTSDEVVEDVTFRGFTVKNAGLNPPITETGTHTGGNNVATLTNNTKSWTPGALVGQWVHNYGDRDIDYSPARSYGQITANTATTVTASLSGGKENDWDTGDPYLITPYKHFHNSFWIHYPNYDGLRGISIANGKDILIQNCKITDSGYGGITTGYARCVSTHKYSEYITIDSCIITDHPTVGINIGNNVGPFTVTNNVCERNKRPAYHDATREYSGYGIQVSGTKKYGTASGLISNNICRDNGFEGIVVSKNTDGVTVEDNTVTGHNFDEDGAGIFMYHWGHPELCKNHIVRNNIVTGNIRGIVAYYASYITIEGNTVTTDSGTFPQGQGAIKLDNANNILVKDNIISCDGTGITVMSYSPSSNSNDNTFTGNTITGAKFAGVLIYGPYARDNTFTGNTITGTTWLTLWAGTPWVETQADGVFIDDDAGTGNVFHYNNIEGNKDDGMENQITTTVDAEFNWWGHKSGPGGEGPGKGDDISEYVEYSPWLGYTVGTSPMTFHTDDVIQDAVDEASDGDTIIVHAGTYSESVSVVGFTSLTIEAEGASRPTKSVLVNPTPTGGTSGFTVYSDGVTIEGFEIAFTNFGIWWEGSNNKFSNNYIHDIASTTNWWDGGIGICLWDMNGGSNNNEITNNVIEDIERTGILLDIAWTDGGTGINTGNSINRNKFGDTPWGAIEVLNAEDTSINHNMIQDCGDWGIALLNAEDGIESNDNTIAFNDIEGAHGSWGVGILVYAWAGSAEENDVHHNDIRDISGSWYSIGIWIISNYNTIHHNSVDPGTVTNPYRDSGTGNTDFKNSWN